MKICNKCNVEKPLEDFHTCKANKDGKYNTCKACKHSYDLEYRKKIGNKYYSKEKAKNKYRKNPIGSLLNSIRHRSNKNNIPFNLEREDIIIPEFCPILEIPIFMKPYKEGTFSFCPNSPSVDRIIPSLGYVKGNIQVISMKANIMKSNATLEELITFSKNILKLYDNP